MITKLRASHRYDFNDAPDDLQTEINARFAEITNEGDLKEQKSTPIPAMFSQFFKFIQNPSTVSVATFKRMVDTDDTVGSGVDFLTTCLAARVGSYTHKSEEITAWVNKALEEVQGGFPAAMKEMLGAVWAGFSVAEKVWANTDLGFVCKKLVPMPPSTVLFEVERTGEISYDGILQYQRGYNPANMNFAGGYGFAAEAGGLARNDPYARFGDSPFPLRTGNTFNYMSVRVPRDKCIHFPFNAQGQFGNPYGRSMLRRAYKWYVAKDGFLQMLAVALDRKGTPLTIVYADQSSTVLDGTRANSGNNQRGVKGAGVRADVAAANAFANIHNDSTIILPGKKGQIYETDFVPQASNAVDFMEAIALCDRGILRALLIPSLMFGSGEGSGSYALGQQHSDTFNQILDGMLFAFKDCLIQQYVKDLLSYNFPASAFVKDGYGSFGKIDMTPDQLLKEMEILEKAVNLGAVDMNDLNDLNKIRDKIGYDPRTTPVPRPELDSMFGDDNGEGGGEEGAGKKGGGSPPPGAGASAASKKPQPSSSET